MEMNQTVQDFINQVQEKNFAKAEPTFKDMMTQKISDALDAEKIAVANAVHNGVEPVEEPVEEPEASVEPEEEISSE